MSGLLQGSSKLHENFSHMNKSWVTVITFWTRDDIFLSTDNLKRSTCINPIMKINQNKLNKASTITILLKG